MNATRYGLTAYLMVFSLAGAFSEDIPQIIVDQWQPIAEDRWPYLSKNALYSEVSTKEVAIEGEGMTPTGEPIGWITYLSEFSSLHFLAHGKLGPEKTRANWLGALPRDEPIKGLLLMPAYSYNKESLDALRVEWTYGRQDGVMVHRPQRVQIIESTLIPITIQGASNIEFGHIGSSRLVYRDKESGDVVASVAGGLSGPVHYDSNKDNRTVWVHPGYDIQFMYEVHDLWRRFFYESDIVSAETVESRSAVVVMNKIKAIPRREVVFIFEGERIQFSENDVIRLRDRQKYVSYDNRSNEFAEKVYTQGSSIHVLQVQQETDSIQIPFNHKKMLYPAQVRLPSHIAAISNPVWEGVEVRGNSPHTFYDLKEPLPWSEIEAVADVPIEIELVNKEVLR